MKIQNEFRKEIRRYSEWDFEKGRVQKIQINSSNEIGGENGGYCQVYSFSKKKAIKVPRNEENPVDYILEEYENHLIALEKGISTPKIFGLCFAYLDSSTLPLPGIVMQDLGRKTLDRLSIEEAEADIFNSWRKEREKMGKRGFLRWDSSKRTNAIWVSEEKKVYLIDWGRNRYLGNDKYELLNKIYARHKNAN